MSRSVDLMTLKHSSYGSVPLAMLNGNLRFPRVLDVAPKPANDLVLESTQGKLKPKALRRTSANLPRLYYGRWSYSLHLGHPICGFLRDPTY